MPIQIPILPPVIILKTHRQQPLSGKPHQAALDACARKLLVFTNNVVAGDILRIECLLAA
ncbi:MAG: hypothetical protein IPK66_06520 [Rhodospirillales bacterium]|nr:hypothetical protein [Rhodospirillales bacterium]